MVMVGVRVRIGARVRVGVRVGVRVRVRVKVRQWSVKIRFSIPLEPLTWFLRL